MSLCKRVLLQSGANTNQKKHKGSLHLLALANAFGRRRRRAMELIRKVIELTLGQRPLHACAKNGSAYSLHLVTFGLVVVIGLL